MKGVKKFVKKIMSKNGIAIASFAFLFAAFAANTACAFPFYEAEEPQGLKKLKKNN